MSLQQNSDHTCASDFGVFSPNTLKKVTVCDACQPDFGPKSQFVTPVHRILVFHLKALKSHRLRRLSTDTRQQSTDNRQEKTDNRKHTNNRQQTTDNRQQTTASRQQTTNTRHQTTDKRQQTTDNKQQATDNIYQHCSSLESQSK